MSDADNSSEEGLIERYPHYKTYKACQSSAFMTGSVTLLGVTACVFVAMDHWFQRYKPTLSKNWLIAGPMLVGTLSAYIITMTKTVQCQNMWMAMEERHSVLTSAEERLAARLASKQ